MSLVIVIHVREGIVLASDSRVTITTTTKQGPDTVLNLSVGMSDANYKTFLTKSNVGITTYGAADIKGVPLAGFIESLLTQKLASGNESPEQVADAILDYFKAMPDKPNSNFLVAGYATHAIPAEQQVWRVQLHDGSKARVNPPDISGSTWGGEMDVLARLIQPIGQKDQVGKYIDLPQYDVPWNFFTLQDAIDFAIYAIRATIDSMRFHNRAKTVGGPIDVLVIKPDRALWIQRKRLHGDEEGPTTESTVP